MLLEHYSWHSFTIITGMIAGHRNFEQVKKALWYYTLAVFVTYFLHKDYRLSKMIVFIICRFSES